MLLLVLQSPLILVCRLHCLTTTFNLINHYCIRQIEWMSEWLLNAKLPNILQLYHGEITNDEIMMFTLSAISWRDYKRWDYDVHIVSYIMARLQTMRSWCSHCQLYHGEITNDEIMMFTLSAISWRDYKRWDYDAHIVSHIMARLQTMRLWCSHCSRSTLWVRFL